MFSSKDLFFTPAATGAFTVSKSLRFRSSASAYLSRTQGAATNGFIWTWSAWVKRGSLGSNQVLFCAGAPSNTQGVQFLAADTIQIFRYTGTYTVQLDTTQVFRDPSAWYHLVIANDGTQATASNRVKFYVNGTQVTSFTTATYPAQNTQYEINNNGQAATIGRYSAAASSFFDGYLAEVNFIDGQALTPSSFGAYDTNGVWQPARYTGSYGTNGFYLPFTNTTSTTTLVADSSGNGNNWTPNNISLTAGVTYDSMLDSPTNATGDIGNYCVMNPVYPGSNLSNGNLRNTAGYGAAGSISVTSGKWYYEFTPTVSTVADSNSYYGGIAGDAFAVYALSGNKYTGSWVAFGASYTTGDIIGCALDVGGGTVTFYKNNVSQGTQTISGGSFFFYSNISSANTNSIFDYNFGQRPFAYTPPSGYSALNTQNLTTPTITNGAQYMAATTYTGTSSSNPISNATNNTIGTTFQPDFVWIKNRNYASGTNHVLIDSVRGASLGLASNLTNADFSTTGNFSSINNNGFTVTGTARDYNFLNDTFVGWQWKGGGTGVTNTSGSITSTVSASATAGFSVVTWTATGANANIGHGLGVIPSMIIVKSRNAAYNWPVYHVSTGNTGATYLNLTSAFGADSALWQNTTPTSSIFYTGTNLNVSGSGQTQVAYCFAPVAGYSAFGSYTGNGSTDGPFVYCGFRPRWILWKRSDGTPQDWFILDTSRDTYNQASLRLCPDLANAEASSSAAYSDILSNGFKVRSTDNATNASGGTYIYAAFAENPFKISRAR